ncbi:MAG TPA: TerB family tellurite resistance protein [Gammaproteobacteria bacterium]|nr:TerB family tellurite resistance protein [Gammaproteobacteria bacterium]
MLKALAEIFSSLTGDGADEAGVTEHELQLATALLLVEIARADYALAAVEQETIIELLTRHFSLADDEIQALVEQAHAQADHVASLQAFTRNLHEELDYPGKLKIVEMLWEVAFADRELSKHEDGLVRKIGDLLYVSHGDQIRLRNTVMQRRAGA